MTPHWQTLAEPPARNGPALMDAQLCPHRSLSRGMFAKVLLGFATLNGGVSLSFILRGAYPVAAFLLLAVFLLWLAFDLNYRAARIRERVFVSTDLLVLTRWSAQGRERHWAVSPLWARTILDDNSVRIASGGRSMRVGDFLSPLERKNFRHALDEALWRARNGNHNPSTSRIV